MWKKIDINKNLIHETKNVNSLLFSMPHKSELAGYKFFFPAKLIENSKDRNKATVLYNDDFVFHLKNYGDSKYMDIDGVREKEISATEFEDIFMKHSSDYEPEIPLIHTPPKMEPENTIVDESLIDYEH